MTISPPNCCRRSISAAAKPAAPPPTITIRPGASADALRPRLRLLALSPDEDAIALVLDLPDRERCKRGRARRLPGPQIEAGVMPGAADTAVDHEPLGKRAVIMTAMGIDGEYLGSRAHQQNFLIANMAEQGLAAEISQRQRPVRDPARRPRPALQPYSFPPSSYPGPSRASPGTIHRMPGERNSSRFRLDADQPAPPRLVPPRRGYSAAYFCASCSAAGGWPLDFRVWLQRASAFEKLSR